MLRVFQPRGYFTVPDGTEVSPFLNATDAKQDDVPWGALGDVSIASGRIAPKTASWVHVHPVVTQITYICSGRLTIRMRDADAAAPYELVVHAGQAVITRPGTLFQLHNDGEAAAEVLYIVSPSYVFEMSGKDIVYSDAVLVARTWEDVAPSGGAPAMASYEARASREEAKRRLAQKKGHRAAITDEAVHSLKAEYDYLAPDGSEIRSLVSGANGGLAHCVLPAGRTSSPVAHRTVEELWYVLEGAGQIWRRRAAEPPRVDSIKAGDSLRIPVGTAFQFRAGPGADLKLLLATMPPWPGPQEAVPAPGAFETAT